MKNLTSSRFPVEKLGGESRLSATAVLSVSELNRQAKSLLERELPLLWISGEVSNLTRAPSGHVYFVLKDESAQVRCVMFRSRAQLVPWQLTNGQQVEARSLVSLYEPRGEFQLGVESIRRAGQGRLYEAFMRLRQRLEDEGLFAEERKRPIPPTPKCIGIVSSPQAAALEDVIAALRRRAPHVQLILYPSPVQGDSAPAGLVEAINKAGQHGICELLLVVRGGGSIEDLWAFNAEEVARAVAGATIPVITGVGHETDTTIVDLVADLRAATPTAAAEIASAGWFASQAKLTELARRLSRGIQARTDRLQQCLDELDQRLLHPAARIAHYNNRAALLASRLEALVTQRIQTAGTRLLRLEQRLERAQPRIGSAQNRLTLLAHRLRHAGTQCLRHGSQQLQNHAVALDLLNPDATVARGYAIVRNAEGNVIGSTDDVAIGDGITVQLMGGRIGARIETVENAPIHDGAIAHQDKPY